MREIKFRCWNPILKQMEYSDLWLVVDHENGYVRPMVRDTKDNYDAVDVSSVYLMQYIGLKDKNGVEIYEGDIIKDNRKVSSVYYDEYEAKFDTAILEKLTFTNALGYEVIGSIYENPELLKDTNNERD